VTILLGSVGEARGVAATLIVGFRSQLATSCATSSRWPASSAGISSPGQQPIPHCKELANR
jgi:hypothetical protein